MNFKEVFSPVYGISIGKFYVGYTKKVIDGTPSFVEFSAEDVLKKKSGLIGFYHTHPKYAYYYSSTDYNTMEAWTDCLGKNLLCIIQPEGYKPLGYWFERDDRGMVEGKCFKVGRFVIGIK